MEKQFKYYETILYRKQTLGMEFLRRFYENLTKGEDNKGETFSLIFKKIELIHR